MMESLSHTCDLGCWLSPLPGQFLQCYFLIPSSSSFFFFSMGWSTSEVPVLPSDSAPLGCNSERWLQTARTVPQIGFQKTATIGLYGMESYCTKSVYVHTRLDNISGPNVCPELSSVRSDQISSFFTKCLRSGTLETDPERMHVQMIYQENTCEKN